VLASGPDVLAPVVPKALCRPCPALATRRGRRAAAAPEAKVPEAAASIVSILPNVVSSNQLTLVSQALSRHHRARSSLC
jgi:hypothetical protein